VGEPRGSYPPKENNTIGYRSLWGGQ
jgi:hypothetical protein